MLKDFFKNSSIMALIGVLIGSLITGFFSYKIQKSSLDSQERQFKMNYVISHNQALRENLSEYINCLSTILVKENEIQKSEMKELISKMISISFKIALMDNPNIGKACFNLADQFKNISENGSSNEKVSKKIVVDWMTSIAKEMQEIDNSVNNKSQIDTELLEKALSK